MTRKMHITPVAALCWVTLLIWGGFFAGLQSIIDTVRLPGQQGSNFLMGSLITLFFVGYMVASFFMGEVSDRIGKKRTIYVMLGIKLVGELLVFFSAQMWMLIAGIIMSGAGFGVLESMFSSVQAEETGQDSRTMLLAMAFFGAGALIVPFIIRSAFNFQGAWRSFFLWDIILLCVVAAYFLPMKFGAKSEYSGEQMQGSYTLKILKQPLFIMLALCIMCYLMMEIAVTFWTTSYFKFLGRADLGALALTLFYVMTTLFRALSALFKNAEHKIMFIGDALIFIGFLGMMLFHDPILSVVFVAICGVGCAALWPILVATASKAFQRYSGTVMTLMLCAAALGGTVFPILFGALSDVFGITASFGVVLFSSILFGVFYYSGLRKLRKQGKDAVILG